LFNKFKEITVPGKAHSRLTVTAPAENSSVAVGTTVVAQANGDSDDVAATAKTNVFMRVFYRVNGIPFAIDVYNDAATMGAVAGGKKRFDTDGTKVVQFTAGVTGPHSIRILAWDSQNKIGALGEVRQKVSRFRVV
jgi:hypothetical protein